MNRTRSPLTTWTVALLIAVALVVPRLFSGTLPAAESSAVDVQSAAALGYAKQRLWADFLRTRGESLAGHHLPAPSSSEYRAHLRALGLARRGDQITLIVFPALDRSHQVDRIQVRLAMLAAEITLDVSVLGERQRYRSVGQIRVLADADGALHCFSEQTTGARLLSLWPVIPQPLLP